MKRILILLTFTFYLLPTFGQSPNGMTYQAVVRNSSDQLVPNTTIGIQISILQGSVGGIVVYSESQTPITNANGLISIEIGNGNGFDTINWANGPYFIKTEVDLAGGTNYTITGTSQLLSVPYALHAKTAETVTGTINESDPVFTSSPASGLTNTDIQNWNTAYGWENHATAGYLTQESQILNISNDTIFLTGGSFVKLPAGFDGQYSSLTGTPTNVSSFTNDAGYLASEVDGSVTNELQTLNISNDTVYLTNGGFVKLPAGFSGDYNDLTNKPVIPANVSELNNDAGYLTSYAETDPQVGVNTTDYVSKWSGTSLVSSSIYDNGNVGIGTTSPSNSLHIKGKTSTEDALRLQVNASSFGQTGILFQGNTNNFSMAAIRSFDNNYWNGDLRFYTDGDSVSNSNLIERMIINYSGNVGIGTSTPGAKLEVNGQVKITGGTPGLNKVLTSDASGLAAWSTLTPTGIGAWSTTGNSGTVDGTNFIGTTDNVPLTFKVNNVSSGKIDPILFNTFLGYESGFSNTTGIYNTFLGYEAGISNTIGKWNIGIGSFALKSMNSSNGNANIAIGQSALEADISGGGNVAIGHGAMTGNTSGAINTAIGYGSMTGNISGNNNTALGAYSGQNSTGTANVFLGYQAGYNETGSNKLYIANSNVNPPLIYGDFSTGSVGIGTTTLTSGYATNNKLMVNGGATFTPNTGSDRITVAPLANLNAGYASFLVISPTSLAMTGGEALSKVHVQNASSTIPALWIVNQGTGDLLSLGNSNTYSNSSVVVKNNGSVAIGTTTPNSTSMFQVDLGTSTTNGILITGTANEITSSVPNLGAGSRMMFYPAKAAFRAGSVSGTAWDNTNVGLYSFAGGSNTIASGAMSFAMGVSSVANGGWSTAIGYSTHASGTASTSMGYNTTASGYASTAIGFGTSATGDFSTSMGNSVSTNGKQGSFIIGDNSGFSSSSTQNEMTMRFAGGYRFFSDAAQTSANTLVFNSGNLGIGTTTPTEKLEVNGNVKVSGSIYAPGTIVQTVVQTSEVTSSLNTTTYTEADPSYRISITPKFANSIILIEYSFSINTYFANNTIFRMQLIRNIGGTEVPVGIGPANGTRNQSTFTGRTQGYDTNDNQTIYMIAKDQSLTVGTTYTYGFKYQRETGGTGTCYFNYSMGDSDVYGFSGVMTMKITEIAQ